MFMLALGPIAVVHNQTGTSFSAREIASDYWCQPKIDRLLYILVHTDHTEKPRGKRGTSLQNQDSKVVA